MKARVVVASAALHITAVIGLLVARSAGPRRAVVDIEIVPAMATIESSPPRRVEPALAPGGNPAISPAPHRGPPARAPRPRHDGAPPRALAAPPPEVNPSAPAVPPPGDGAEHGSAGDGAGLGGRGSGDGSGNADIDRSARPVPLNAGDVTLPYAEEAARRRVGGNVIVELSIDPLGHVGRATIARGLGYGLDEIAVRTAMQLRFSPARDRRGRPTATTVRWRFHFDPP